ncbi:hypothetical protein ACOBQJ_03400 [Pelotomaculum propionicicum]|uniref:hypothetical protein n=1 Tax=Pelotomaculum propionicicum TaxID=258475 RepID=UPI003B7B55AA
MKNDTICPPKVKFTNWSTADFFNRAMKVNTFIRRRKEHYWYMCERNLLAALLYYCEGKNIPVNADNVQKHLSAGVRKLRGLFRTLPEKHPGAWYYNLVADVTDPVLTSVIAGLKVRMEKIADSPVALIERFQKELVTV